MATTTLGNCTVTFHKWYNGGWSSTVNGQGFQLGPNGSYGLNGGVLKIKTPAKKTDSGGYLGVQLDISTTIVKNNSSTPTIYAYLYTADPTGSTPSTSNSYQLGTATPLLYGSKQYTGSASADAKSFSLSLKRTDDSVDTSKYVEPNKTYYLWITSTSFVNNFNFGDTKMTAKLIGRDVLSVRYDFYGSPSNLTISSSTYKLSTEGYNRVLKVSDGSIYYGTVTIGNSNSKYTVKDPSFFGITCPGYTFNKYKSSGGTDNIKAGSTQLAEDLQGTATDLYYTYLSGSWTANTYTVTFNANGGSVSTTSKSVTYNSTYGTLPTPERVGYKFNGWFTASSGGSQKQSSTTVTTTSNHTLYAQWTAKTITIKYNANGGSVKSGYTGSETNVLTYGTSSNIYDVDTLFSAPSGWKAPLSGTSYYSAAWIVGGTNTGEYAAQKDINPNAWIEAGKTSITFYARWLKDIVLTYDDNGGSGGPGVRPTVTIAKPASEYTFTIHSTEPTRTGYKFKGWATSKNATVAEYTSGDKVPKGNDWTLYAVWEIEKYTVTLNKDTGISSVSGAGTYNYGASVTINATPSAGYSWSKWTGDKASTTKNYTFTMPASNVTNTAKATANKYTITFNANGGTLPSGLSTLTPTYGTSDFYSWDLLAQTNRAGYTLKGYYDATSGGKQIYKIENSAGVAVSGTYWDSSNKWKYAGNVTAYAQWTGNTYYVKYNGNGNTGGSMSNSTHIYGTSSNLTSNGFTKTGYSFKNWNTKEDGTGTSYANEASITKLTTTKGGTVNLYAQWEIIVYDIKYYWNYNDNITQISGLTPSTYTYNASSSTEVATVPSLNGYTTSGWFDDDACTDGPYSSIGKGVHKTVDLYAKKIRNTYSITYNLNGGSVTGNPTSYNVETTTFTLKNPTKTGYTFSGWTGTGLSSASTSVSVTKGSTGNRSYTANWTANTNTVYKVKHWKQNIDAATTQDSTNYTLATTENLTGTTGASVTPTRKTYTGFTSPSGSAITIAADGSSELNYYYTRNSYTLSLAKGTGISSVNGAGTYHYEKSVTINATVSAGYSWKEWTGGKATTTKNYTFTMPANSVSNTANATAHVLTVNYYAGGATSGTLSSTNLTTSQLNGTSLLLTQTGNYGENFNKVDGSPGLVDYNNSSYLSLRKTGYSVQSGSEWKNKSNGKICDQGGTGNQTITTVAIAEAFGVKTDLQNGNISIDVEVNWQPNIYTITLNNQSATTAGTQTLYLKYDTGWYSNSGATTSINSITCPTKTGYTFGGYYTSTGGGGTQIIDSSGNMVSGKTTFTSSNTTLYAKWTANTYTVTFNANGGSVSTTSKSVTYNSTYGTLPTPTRNGYSFNGWYTASSGGTKRTSSTTVTTTSNHTLYAQWTPNTYTITLDNRSATSAGTQTLYLKYNTGWYSNSGATTSILKITVPTKTGHTFKGYYTSTGGSGTKIIEENGTIDKNNLTFTTSNTTLYAYWTTQPILQIHPNGGMYNGTSGITSIAQDANTELELLKPTRDGYEFAGWFKNYPGELKFKAQVTTGAVEVPGWSSSGTVVGTWLYTETNQDSIFSNSNFLTAHNSTLTRKSSTSAGYDYIIEVKASNVTGGFIQSTSGTTELISGTGQIMTSVLYTFLAKIPIGYSLTSSKSSQIASDGIQASWQTPTKGTGNWETYSYTITSNAQVTVGNICIHLKKDDTTLPSNVTWEVGGCCVQRPGWNATFTFGDADTNLYAQWKPVKSTLSFKGDFLPDASSFPDGSEKKIITYYQTDHNNFWSNLSTATRNGYSLKGYYDATTGGNQIFDNTGNYVSGTYWDSTGKWKYTGNKDVYAQWEINKYTVTFNANGGSGEPSTQTKTYGQTLTLSSTKPTRTGYTFQGWGTSATTTTVSYQAGGSYTNNSNITLYAIWKVVSYSITYNLNGGSVTGNPTSYTIETTTFTLKNPTKEGYKFIGWTGTNLNSSTLEVTIAKGSTGNKSYTANWEAFGTVRIYTNDGWKQAIPYIYDGNNWKQAIPYIYDGNNWKIST